MSLAKAGSLNLAALFMEVVPRAMREFRKDMRSSRSATLTVPQFRIMAQLRYGPANNRSLAEFQGVSVAAMSRMIDWLSKNGLVERLEDKNDRRNVSVQLTPKGRKNFESFRKEARKRLQKRLSTLKPSEQEQLNHGLAALAVAVKHMGDSAEA
jgi:DNA-binding MarR family transcriptional regulator